MAEVTQQQKQALFSFLFDIAPEISDTYNKASKEEKAKMIKHSVKLQQDILCGLNLKDFGGIK